MRMQAKVTAKGQIIVPPDVRRALGVRPGDSLVFEAADGGMRVRPVKAKSPFAKYRSIGNPGIQASRRGILRWLRGLRGSGLRGR
jgi:AbrB family looped-hinge helix DNA binding protein